ncbi:MAG TPA: CsiV family protein [Gammaproteobacteria bacterium]
MRFLIAAAMILACMPSSAMAAAAEEKPIKEATVTWYDVELIVFRNLDTRSAETWPTDAGIPPVEEARPLFPPPAGPSAIDEDAGSPRETDAAAASPLGEAASLHPDTPTPYVPLDESAYQLNDIAERLRQSSKYEPILHVAWTQPPLERSQSPYLRVTLPGSLEAEMPEEDALPLENEQPLLGMAGDAPFADSGAQEPPIETPEFLQDEEQGPQPVRPLDGVVQLSVSRYLHLDLDLVYLPEDINLAVLGDVPAATRQWTEEKAFARERRRQAILEALARGDITLVEAEILALEPEQDVFQGFRLSQYRRLRSGDIHYFDHPVFGAIVKVTPREVSARTLETDLSRPQ